MPDKTFKETSLRYHTDPTPGKFEITPTKPLSNQRDLARAYSPGVAFACEAQYRASGVQAGHGGQGGSVQEICRN